MRSSCLNFQRFVNGVHRRYVACRLIERTGLGLLGGSVAGLVLLPLAIWADKPALPLVCLALGCGAGIGMLWGIFRRPSRLDSAIQADRQLGLNDLLGTALSIESSQQLQRVAGHAWTAAVLAIADDQCGRFTPRSILLSRVSARTWSMIGLSAAGVLVVALFFGAAADSRAAPNRAETFNSTTTPAISSDEIDRPLIAMTPAALPAAAEHDDPDNRSLGQSTPQRPGERIPQPTAPDAESSRANESAAPGTGSGSSQTHKEPTAATPELPREYPHEPVPDRSGTTVTAATASGDAGQPDGTGTVRKINSGGVTGNASQAHLTPPWKTNAWPADVRRARSAIDAGQVPPAYQEMVRRYFER